MIAQGISEAGHAAEYGHRRRSLIPFSWAQEIRAMMGERRVMQEALSSGRIPAT
jgi:hypothetical protein